MNYQGQLTDSSGVPVADGAYSIQFTIYDAPTAGAVVWQETQASVQSSKGLFNAILGSVVPISLGANYANDLWLGVKVGADAEMTPRQQLLPAVYAYNAKRLNGNLVGNGAGNIPQLDGSGKIPASMLGSGSISVPMDMTGPGGLYNLHVNNTSALGAGIISESSTGVGVSATAASVSMPGLWAEGARYGATVKTNDAISGVALQAQGPGSAYASLVDRVNNAQVFGQAAASNTYGVLGTNSNGSGNGVGGQGGFAGVSGSSASNYGVYGQGGYTGVYGKGNTYSVWGDNTAFNFGVRGTSNYIAVYATGSTYGTWSESANTGIHAIGSASSGRGIEAYHFGTGAGEGVHGETSSNAANAKGVMGYATSSGGGATYGVYGLVGSVAGIGVGGYYTAGAAGTARGVQGTSNSTTGIGVEGVGYLGVRGASTAVGGFGVVGTASDSTGYGAYFENTGGGANATGLAVRSLTSTTGIAIQAAGSTSSGIGVSATGGLFGVLANGSAAGVSASSSGGYAIQANGYGGGNFSASNDYALNVYSGNSWAIQINSPFNYGIVNFSANGIYSSATSGNGLYGYTGSGSGGSGVYGSAGCSSCYGVYGYNGAASSGSNGVFGQGYSAIRAQSNSSGSNSINFESDTSNSPQYGFYHFNGSALANSFGMLLQNSGVSAIGVQITNQSPGAGSTGSALVVKGRMRLTDCSGRVNIVSGIATTGWVINSGIIGTAAANCIETNSVIQITPITNTSGYPLYVSTAGTGTFTVNCATPLTNPQFYYTIFGK
jgi:hypothetical protein